MRDRKIIIEDLIACKGDLTLLSDELSLYPWDAETPLSELNTALFLSVLGKVNIGEISCSNLGVWADLIELRDDIDIPDTRVKEFIHELATPELYGDVTSDRVSFIIETLKASSLLPSGTICQELKDHFLILIFIQIDSDLVTMAELTFGSLGIENFLEGDSLNVAGGVYYVGYKSSFEIKLEINSYDYEDQYRFMLKITQRDGGITSECPEIEQIINQMLRQMAGRKFMQMAVETVSGLVLIFP